MFKKLFVAVGIGGASVDTRLDNPRLRPGEVLSGHVLVKGGQAAQDIEKIDLVLMAEAEDDAHDARGALALGKVQVCGRFSIGAGEEKRLPFSLVLPLETPVNALAHYGRPLPVWIHTDLALDKALDAADRDLLEILPTPQLQALLQAFDQLGWSLYQTDVEVGAARVGHVSSSLGCYQEFELRPRARSRWQEIELTLIPAADGVHVLIEADARFGGDSYRSLRMDQDWQRVDWAAELQRLLGL